MTAPAAELPFRPGDLVECRVVGAWWNPAQGAHQIGPARGDRLRVAEVVQCAAGPCGRTFVGLRFARFHRAFAFDAAHFAPVAPRP